MIYEIKTVYQPTDEGAKHIKWHRVVHREEEEEARDHFFGLIAVPVVINTPEGPKRAPEPQIVEFPIPAVTPKEAFEMFDEEHVAFIKSKQEEEGSKIVKPTPQMVEALSSGKEGGRATRPKIRGI